MNRYPLWKYITVLVAFVIGLLYTLPNFYGESPAVQISSAMSTVRVEPAMLDNVQRILDENKIPYEGTFFEQNGPTGTVRASPLPRTFCSIESRFAMSRRRLRSRLKSPGRRTFEKS